MLSQYRLSGAAMYILTDTYLARSMQNEMLKNRRPHLEVTFHGIYMTSSIAHKSF